jgi:hypothetical protein
MSPSVALNAAIFALRAAFFAAAAASSSPDMVAWKPPTPKFIFPQPTKKKKPVGKAVGLWWC